MTARDVERNQRTHGTTRQDTGRSLVVAVDDDASVLALLERMLTSWGFRVRPFSRFEDARASLIAEPPFALVADVRLGEYNGLQLIHLAREVNPKAILVALSGFDDPVVRDDAERAGAVAYLVKPTELHRLRDYLETRPH